jgi:hypothetical protein
VIARATIDGIAARRNIDARSAVFALDLRVNGLDVREQRIVAYAASARLVAADALLALMISAGANFQRFTQG